MASSNTRDLEIRLLGRFEVLCRGEPLPSSSWGRRKTQTLLKVLLTRPGSVFTQDQLIEALYGGENPQTKTHNLRGRISQLRHALEPSMKARGQSTYILRAGQGYYFDTNACWIDTEAFRERLTSAIQAEEAGHWALAAEMYETAISLYGGDFLEENQYEEWSLDVQEDLRGQHLRALARLAHCYAQLQEFDRAGEWCERALVLEPATEPVIRQRMEYAYQSGDQGKALEVYLKGVEALGERLSVEPSKETERLHQEITSGTLPRADRGLDPLRIAVVPLTHIGSDSDDVYFTDGMTEELISRLSMVRDLKVIAQASTSVYRNSDKGVARIGRELRVGTVLEGSVRRDGSHLRIAVQMIDVVSEEHVWSDVYSEELADVFGVQSDIADRVTEALKVQLFSDDRSRIAQERTENPEAYDCYLRGRHFVAKHTAEGYAKGIEYFERALAIDPKFASAYAGLADTHFWMVRDNLLPRDEGFGKAKDHAEKALELDSELSEAHASMGNVYWMHVRDPEKAELHLCEAIEINPSNALAHHLYADLLMNWDRYAEARREVDTALELDPLSPECNAAMGDMLIWVSADIDGAIRHFYRALEIDPTHVWAQSGLAVAKQRAGDWIGAEQILRQLIDQDPSNPLAHQEYAYHLMYQARFDESLIEIDEACRLGPGIPFLQYVKGEILFFARQYDEAHVQLEHVIGLDPSILHSHVILGMMHAVQGAYDASLKEVDTLATSTPMSSFTFMIANALSAIVHAKMGEPAEARIRLDKLLKEPAHHYGLSHFIASVCFTLGDIDVGFEWLERSSNESSLGYFRLKIDPLFDAVRDNPRFTSILKRMNLAD